MAHNNGVPDDLDILNEDVMDSIFEMFLASRDDEDRNTLLSISSPYNIPQMPLSDGDGTKEYSKIIKTIIQGIVFKSNAIGTQDMAELWLAYKSIGNVKANAFFDNVNINKLLEKQGFALCITGKKNVWNSVRETLDSKQLIGVKIPSAKQDLDNLYLSVKKAKSLESIRKTTNYITVSYVQTKNDDKYLNDLMPSSWSENILDAMKLIRKMDIFPDNEHIGIWWDKLAQIQYNGSQKSWPATANLQFPTHMSLVCLPLSLRNDYNSLPLWSNDPFVESIIQKSVDHISSCDSCRSLKWICKRNDPLVSPVMAMRSWPFMEVRLANMNVGAFVTAKQIGYLIDTIQTMMLIWNTCNRGLGSSSDSYIFYMNYLEYCNEFFKSYDDNTCSDLFTLISTMLQNVDRNTKHEIQLEFINILGFLPNLVTNVTILELYISTEKEQLHPTIKKMCEMLKAEYRKTDESNLNTLRRKLMLKSWKPESIANAINEVLNGYSHKSKCFREADKIIAAVALMDIELTQNVLLEWDPDTGIHPFAELFANEKNWNRICESDNMNCLFLDTPMNIMQDISSFWMGCMQSKINGKVFLEAITDPDGGMSLHEDVIRMIQDKLQKVFLEKINIKGQYYDGINTRSIGENECISCLGMQKKADVIGRYTFLGTKQLRGITQGIINGDTQIVIGTYNEHGIFSAEKAGMLSITFNNGHVKTCKKCNKMWSIVCNHVSVPIGVVVVHIDDNMLSNNV